MASVGACPSTKMKEVMAKTCLRPMRRASEGQALTAGRKFVRSKIVVVHPVAYRTYSDYAIQHMHAGALQPQIAFPRDIWGAVWGA